MELIAKRPLTGSYGSVGRGGKFMVQDEHGADLVKRGLASEVASVSTSNHADTEKKVAGPSETKSEGGAGSNSQSK